MILNVIVADYHNADHAAAIGYLLNHYAQDPMGGGIPLPAEVTNNLAAALARIPHAFTVLCYENSKPVGLINGFEAFSTFKCKPLINIHDVIVKHNMPTANSASTVTS